MNKYIYYTPINGVSEQSLFCSSFDDDSDNILEGLRSTFLSVVSFFSVLFSKLFTFLPIDLILKLYGKKLSGFIFYTEFARFHTYRDDVDVEGSVDSVSFS